MDVEFFFFFENSTANLVFSLLMVFSYVIVNDCFGCVMSMNGLIFFFNKRTRVSKMVYLY